MLEVSSSASLVASGGCIGVPGKVGLGRPVVKDGRTVSMVSEAGERNSSLVNFAAEDAN